MQLPLKFITAQTFLMLTPCIILCILPFRKHLMLSLSGSWLVGSSVILGLTFATALGFSPHNPFYNWLLPFSIFIFILLVCLCLTLLKAPSWQILCAIFILENYADSLTLLTNSLLFDIIMPFLHVPKFSGAIVTRTVLTLLSAPAMWFFMVHILLPAIEENEVQPYWRYLWMIPAAFYALFHIGVYPNSLKNFMAQASPPPLLPYIWIIGNFLCYTLVLVLLRRTAENTRLHEQLELSQERLNLQREQFDRLLNSIRDTQRARHDLRHQLLAMEGYCRAGDYEKLTLYLQNQLRITEYPDGRPICENAALDAIIRHYTQFARKAGTEISLSVALPKELSIPDNDMYVLLGNLLENAAEAVMRQSSGYRFIDLKLGISGKKMLTLILRNSYTGEIHENSGQFQSSKRPGNGIGLASVQSIVTKYNGILKIEYADGTFTVSILLNG